MGNRSLVALAAGSMVTMWIGAAVVFGQANPEDIFFPVRAFYVSHEGVEDLEWEFSISPGAFEWVPIPDYDIQPETICRSVGLDLPFEDGTIRSRVPDQGGSTGPSEWIEREVPEPALGLSLCMGTLFLGILGRARRRAP